MDGALLARQQACSHLGTHRAQSKRSGKLTPVCNASRRDNGNVNRVDHLRNERHGRGLAHMATALRTLGNHAVNVITRQTAGQNGGRHHGEYLDSSGFPLVHILARVTCTGGKNAHVFFDNDLRQLVDMRVHKHEVHAKRLVRQSARRANLLA